MVHVDPRPARTLRFPLTILAVVLLLSGGLAQIAAQQIEPGPAAGDASGAPRKATLLDPPDLVIFNTGEVKGALAPGG